MFENQKKDSAAHEQSEIAAGIPSVAGKRNANNKSLFLLFAACVMVGFIGIAAWSFKGNLLGETEVETPPANDVNVYTSSKSLTVPPVPPKKADPVPEPVIKEEPKEKAPLPPPVPLVAQPAVVPQPVQPQKQEPTLEERRFAAPLMSANAENSSATVQGAPVGEDFDGTPGGDGGRLGGMLSAVNTPGAKARRMPNRTFLLPKGTFIDCILETKVDTTVPGMTSCIVPRPLYSADGKVLLIERGSKIIGEYKGAVENGLNRIFVLWTQLQTPTGVRINLDSPGTDEMGGSGLSGHVDYHWWKRFGNALLFSLIQDGFEFAGNLASENNGGVNYYQNSQNGMEEIVREAMRQSGNIPPTLTRNQGSRIGIFVGRDLDFSSVYGLALR